MRIIYITPVRIRAWKSAKV